MMICGTGTQIIGVLLRDKVIENGTGARYCTILSAAKSGTGILVLTGRVADPGPAGFRTYSEYG
jgi:hypothetical protein